MLALEGHAVPGWVSDATSSKRETERVRIMMDRQAREAGILQFQILQLTPFLQALAPCLLRLFDPSKMLVQGCN